MRAVLLQIPTKYKPYFNRFNYLAAAALLAFSAAIGTLAPRLAAAQPDATHAVINEILSKPKSGDREWVELFNPTSEPINIGGWKIKSGNRIFANISQDTPALEPGGYFVTEATDGTTLSDSGQNLYLLNSEDEEVDHVSYPALEVDQSFGRSPDGSTNLVKFAPDNVTRNSQNYVHSVPEPDPGPEPHLAAEEFTTVDGRFKGISVGLNVKHFGAVSSITAELERADGTIVTKTSGPAVLNLVNNPDWNTGNGKLTIPFVIQEGSFKELEDTDASGNLYWNPAPAEWNVSTMPTKVTITVVGEQDTKSVTNTNFTQGTTSYYSLLPQSTSTVIVSGDTASGENQPGWLFDRDQKTSTPYEFNTDDASIGNGSIYVPPISGDNPKNKFIAEHFLHAPIAEVKSISYDFKIGKNGTPADAKHFYMNAYVNFNGDASEYGHCVYNIVPTAASGWTTVTFDPNNSYDVRTRNTAPAACPASPSQISGGMLRMFALNVGDSSTEDAGLDGHLDKVVVDRVSSVITYDFEPKTESLTAPEIIKPSDEQYFNTQPILNEWTPTSDPSNIDYYQVAYLYDDKHKFGNSTCPGEKINGQELSGCRNEKSTSRKHKPNISEQGGVSVWVRAIDKSGNASDWSAPVHYYYDATAPIVTINDKTNYENQYFSGDFSISGFAEDVLLSDGWASGVKDVRLIFDPKNGGSSYNYSVKNNPDLMTYNPSTDAWTFGGNLKNLGINDGEYVIKVRAIDNAGNLTDTTNVNKVKSVNIDNTTPKAQILSPGNGNFVNGIVTLKGQVTDDNPMNSHFQIEGPNSYKKTSTKKDGRTLHEFKWNTAGLSDGEYTIYFEVRDKANNKGGERANPGESVHVIKVKIDRTSPIASITSPANNSILSGLVNVTGQIQDNMALSHYNLSLYPGDVDLSDGETHTNRRINNLVGWDSYPSMVNVSGSVADIDRPLDTTLLPDGEYQLRLAARDKADNRDLTDPFNSGSSSVHVVSFTVDNTAPAVDAGTDDTTEGLNYNLKGTASDSGAGLASTSWTLASGPGVATFDDEGSLNINVTVSDFGTYVFKLTAIDTAGNASEDTVSITFKKEVLPPQDQASEQPAPESTNSRGSDTPNNEQPNQILGAQANDPDTRNQANNTNDGDEGEESSAEPKVLSVSSTDQPEETAQEEIFGATTSGLKIASWWWLLLLVVPVGACLYATRPKTKKN